MRAIYISCKSCPIIMQFFLQLPRARKKDIDKMPNKYLSQIFAPSFVKMILWRKFILYYVYNPIVWNLEHIDFCKYYVKCFTVLMHIYINVFISLFLSLRGRVSSNLLFKWETELDLTINTRIIGRRLLDTKCRAACLPNDRSFNGWLSTYS